MQHLPRKPCHLLVTGAGPTDIPQEVVHLLLGSVFNIRASVSNAIKKGWCDNAPAAQECLCSLEVIFIFFLFQETVHHFTENILMSAKVFQT